MFYMFSNDMLQARVLDAYIATLIATGHSVDLFFSLKVVPHQAALSPLTHDVGGCTVISMYVEDQTRHGLSV